MFEVHQQTIRLYEREGLIAPKRSDGNTRLFTEEDIARLEEVIHLTHELGINLAGVEMILKLKKQIGKMQRDMNKVFDDTQKELDKQTIESKHTATTSTQRLIAIKKESTLTKLPLPEETSIPSESNEWHIDYEDQE